MRQTIPETAAIRDDARVIERPDGFYWQSRLDGREYGPFATLLEAMQDLAIVGEDEAPAPGETLAEAEAELGISDWVDPDTGEPGEEDGVRIEER